MKKIEEILNRLKLSNNVFCKTKKEIAKKILELSSDGGNFTCDNYGSEAADNGIYETYYSEYLTEDTLIRFVEWLFEK